MRIKIGTWNLNRSKQQLPMQLKYLRNTLKLDLAFLQETYNPNPLRAQGQPCSVFRCCIDKNGKKLHWGSTIWTRDLPLKKFSLDGYLGQPGRVVGATTTLPDSTSLYLVCIHVPTGDNNRYVFPNLETVFCELDVKLTGTRGIIGGDLNTARKLGIRWPKYGHREFWASIDRGRFVDCHYSRHSDERQTFYRRNAKLDKLKIQDDHLFVTSLLEKQFKDCKVINTPKARELSDHLPVIATLDL